MSPDLFGSCEESWPKYPKELAELYNSVENKCILTARGENKKAKLTEVLKELNLDIPKYGIYMRPDRLKNAGLWKGKKIIEILKKLGFNNAIFYDDNPRYIKSVKKITSKYPNFKVKLVKV